MEREDKIKVENPKGFMLAVKKGIISQLYKDGFLTEVVYRKLMFSLGFSLEKPD
jgi:hypothetical protein